MSENQIIELLKSTMERFENKLDSINKELQEYKQNFQTNLLTIQNRVEIQETKVKSIENTLSKPFKERILDMVLQGIIYSISTCLGISIFFMILKGIGGNILTILKPILSAFVGV